MRTIDGYEAMHLIRKGQIRWLAKGDVVRPASVHPQPLWDRCLNHTDCQTPLIALGRHLQQIRSKYLALIFAIAFSSFLVAQQASIFAGLMNRTRSQILDITDADIWVMNRATQYVDEIYAVKDSDLYRVRGVPGVRWAVPLLRGLPRAKAADGKFRVVILLGLDDASLVGAQAQKMILGSAERLREPNAAFSIWLDITSFFRVSRLSLARYSRSTIMASSVGICDASAPFTIFL